MASNTTDSVLRERIAAAAIARLCDLVLGMDFGAGNMKDDHPRVVAHQLGLSAPELASIGVFVGDLPLDMTPR